MYDDVDLLSLDAGNTIIFLDHARVAELLWNDHHVTDMSLVVAEGFAKRALAGDGKVVDIEWSRKELPGAASWGKMIATMLARANVPKTALPAALERLWDSHVAFNLYSKVPEGFREAMKELRAGGVKVAVVSNSEGMLESLFTKLELIDCFDALVDSASVGVEKPDPRIFAIACERTGTTADRALHLGDTIATDIEGAKNAGMRALLIDPFGHYQGLAPDVPRGPNHVAAAVEVSREILKARR